MDPVRVDDGCHAKLTDKSRVTPLPKGFDASKPRQTLYQSSMEPRNARVETDSFDADLKKALEMSLEEVKGHTSSGSGYVSQAQLQSQAKSPVTNGTSRPSQAEPEEEDDADLKAAIAASIADMEEQKKRHAATLRHQASSSNGAPAVAPKNDYELTPVEAENINLFSTLVDRLQHQPPGTILREPQIQELYESIGKLRPKLARTYGETMSKHGKWSCSHFVEGHLTFHRHTARSSRQALNSCPILRSHAGGETVKYIYAGWRHVRPPTKRATASNKHVSQHTA